MTPRLPSLNFKADKQHTALLEGFHLLAQEINLERSIRILNSMASFGIPTQPS